MGPTIINWLTLLGENRSACLLLDDGNYSRSFELGRGRAQGDNISPNTFNFGEQILIFKIELDKNITGVWQNFLIPPHIGANTDPLFMYESRGETHKNESLADDNTTLMELTENNLRSLRNILDGFGSLSGLKCNYDKTMVMPVGNTSHVPRNLFGFSLTNKIKLLGAEITNNWEDLEKNFDTVAEKIENLIQFWERFRLTLPGRIAIIKTLLIPQLNYLGCFLSPSDETIKRIQLSIDSFALKGQVVSSDRRYLLPEQGGVGLFKIDEFLFAQKCSWIKRVFSSCNDNWRLVMRIASPKGKIEYIRSCDFDPRKNIILYEIAASFELFVSCFSLVDNNYRKTPIFMNGAFQRSGNDPRTLSSDFFGKNTYETNYDVIRTLTYDDCFSNGKFKSINEFLDLGFRMPVSLWMRLRSALIFSKKNLVIAPDKPGRSIGDFLKSFKKGSKPFRRIIQQAKYLGESPDKLTIVKTFSKLTNTDTPSVSCLKLILSSWNKVFLDNHLREFIFKCRNNSLRTRDRLSHLLDIDDNCKFCYNLTANYKQRETFVHLLRQCPVTSSVLEGFLLRYGITPPPTVNTFDDYYWYGTIDQYTCKISLLIFDIFRYCIWLTKNRHMVPRLNSVCELFGDIFGAILNRCPWLTPTITNLPHIANILRATG
jgi:hypothetical protein